MNNSEKVFMIITVILSATFGAVLFLNIVDEYGVRLSLFWSQIGMLLIWIIYYIRGRTVVNTVSKEGEGKKIDQQSKGE